MNYRDMAPTVKSVNKTEDSFDQLLREADEFFHQSNISMISNHTDILSEQGLFTQYTSMLSEGLSADDALLMEQLFENSRYEILRESHVGNVTPIAGLSMPVVRKLWVKTAMKNVIPTEVAKKPAFTIAWLEPYMRDAAGKKSALPAAGRDTRSMLQLKAVPMPEEGLAPGVTHNLITLAQAAHGAAKRDALDPKVYITGVITAEGTTKVRVKLDVKSAFYAKVNVGTEAAPKVAQFFGNCDTETGEFTVTVTGDGGAVTGILVDARLTQENNERVESVSYDVRTKDIRIGTGAHLQTELPIEFLQDNMALYNIDATVECIDLMTQVVAQRLDQEIIDFLEQSDLDQGAPFQGVFDVRPAAGFAGSPTEWRHELRTTIEWWANRVKSYNVSNFVQGHFVIFGSPIDIQLIPDIQWQFHHATAERAGVSVNYDFGILTASNVFQVVQTENMDSGELVMIFVPSNERFMTYKYYPYAFNIEKGYISPNMPNVPSVMMTKRHAIEELFPMQVRIRIDGNNGNLISSYRL